MTLLFALALVFLAILPARAQNGRPALLRNVGIDQKLNQSIPLDIAFRDETGKTVQLREYFGKKPVILSLVYYNCPMLCTMVLNGLLRSMRAMSLNAGEHFNVVTVSFDPRDTPATAAAKKQTYIERYRRPGTSGGWHFLTGDEASIHRLTQAVGFRYAYDPKTGQYAHASGIMVLTPQGKLARYFYGVEYSTRDIRLALVEASAGKIGSPTDQVLLFCFHYDPTTGKYGLVITRVLQAAGVATVLGLVLLMLLLFRRDRRAVGRNYAH
jgi:protein SCO1/2